jgi:hypothetical protein
MQASQLLISYYVNEADKKQSQVPSLARCDAEDGAPERYVMIKGKAIRVFKSGQIDKYFRFDVNTRRNVATYVGDLEVFSCVADVGALEVFPGDE